MGLSKMLDLRGPAKHGRIQSGYFPSVDFCGSQLPDLPHNEDNLIQSGSVLLCGYISIRKMTAMVRIRPTKVQGMAFERILSAPEDSNGTQTLPHARLGIENGG